MAEIAIRLSDAAGEYMDSATVVEWLKAIGDTVCSGETLAIVETAKAATEIPAPADGVLTRIDAPAGSEVARHGTLGAIAPAGSADMPVAEAPPAAPPPQGASADCLPGPAAQAASADGWIVATPIARRLAREQGIDLATLRGTGPGGRVQEQDVRTAMAAAQRPASAERRDKTDLYRRAMARRMATAPTAPQFSVSLGIDGTALLAWIGAARRAGATFSENDAILRATALALRVVPRFNQRWEDGAPRPVPGIHVGMAVATEAGLAVPVIADCDQLDLAAIASASFRLRRRALACRLGADEMRRCGFTVSNLGPLGAESFVATLNPPEAGILAVGAFLDTPMAVQDAIVLRRRAHVTVTGDHRIVDGADATRFLKVLRELLETPATLEQAVSSG
jgi:pyruvate dehydrogenase E2 component (dihydrolipoamide acetyltransferase)